MKAIEKDAKVRVTHARDENEERVLLTEPWRGKALNLFRSGKWEVRGLKEARYELVYPEDMEVIK